MSPGSSSPRIPIYAQFLDLNKNWYNNRRIIILNLWILLLLCTSFTSSYDGNIIYSFQSLPQWMRYFNYPDGGTLNLLNNMRTIGSLVALPIAPYIADGLGRRASIFMGALSLCVATAFQTGSNSLGMFVCARFLIGFGFTFATTAAPLLIAEIAYPTYRAPLTSAYGSLWYSGAMAASCSAFSAAKIPTAWSWRLPLIIQLIPSVLQMTFIWFGPESPRWLISQNRNVEALETLAYYHADGDTDDLLVKFEYEQIKTAINREVITKIGLRTLFTTAPYAIRLKVLFVLAFSSPWYAYPFTMALMTAGITDSGVHFLLTGILQVWNLFWALLAASFVDRFGRRVLFLTSISGMVVFFSLQTASSSVYVKTGSQAAAHAFIVFIFLFYTFFSLAIPTLFVSYSIEIFPYSLRAKGITWFNFTACLAAVFSQNVRLPFGFGPFEWNIVYVVLLVVVGYVYWKFIIETKNRTLEETGTLFGGIGTSEPAVPISLHSIRVYSSEEGEKRRSQNVREYVS